MNVFAEPIEKYETGSPEWRSALFAEAVRYTAHLEGPIRVNSLQEHLLRFTGGTEEECGGEILMTLCLLIHSGLYTASTYNRATMTLIISAATTFTASPVLTMHIHGEHESGEIDEDDEEDDA
ncbi:hypothetical protein [Methylobacterium sp. Leaf117]|uniref:hypothetical protein n=1 Tax=Methylobacterium sp. Leaf117 TaxID=1736260 RepID=UPI0006F67094|nr:hypothetical protein [Methylobacterium sp. Leaf117]KQP82872.1 hypothetical protein ASF57_12105 [Methylobacterium sp. Leaf117]